MFKRKSKDQPNNKLRTFNNGLTFVVLSVSVYIIVLPFLPFLTLWWSEFTDSSNGYRYDSQLARDAGQTDNLTPPPENNTLVIPGIQIDHSVTEGADISALSVDGVWRRPNTSTPDQGGNTVMVAHRFSYSEPATFYHLDKVDVGERFAVWWEQEEYVYEVFDVSVVPPTAIEIESQTDEPIVTLYTCTPVWTAAERLVVKARLVNIEILEEETVVNDEVSFR